MQRLPGIHTLKLEDCDTLTNLELLRRCPSLRKLDIYGCKRLTTLDGVQGLPSLQRLVVVGCGALRSIRPLTTCTAMEELRVSDCRSLPDSDLTTLQGIAALPRLTTLRLDYGPRILAMDTLRTLVEEG
jgi:hypothetical protein